jgi:hypothetical protein
MRQGVILRHGVVRGAASSQSPILSRIGAAVDEGLDESVSAYDALIEILIARRFVLAGSKGARTRPRGSERR